MLRLFVCGLLIVGLSGCASVPDGFIGDPLESMNRGTDKFNRDFDKTIAKPVAEGYRRVLPDPVDRGISNFLANLADFNSAVNNLLQVKPVKALSDVGRLSINSTIGLLGFVDVASEIGLKSYKEDLGQTLGYWGVGDSPYLVIPVLGPSNLRDFIGLLGDVYVNPVYYTSEGIYWALLVLNYIDTRADLIETTDVLEEAAVDPYAFVRETYLQVRRNKVYDGEPPIEEELLFDDEAPFAE
ncbi:MAG: VacJ family lipoprotein [Pseudomonadota bacterium]